MPTLTQKLRYRFDNTLSRGPMALIAWLGIVSAAMIAVFALVVYVTGVAPEGEGGERPGFLDLAWMSLMRTLDAGTMGGDTGSWIFLLLMLGVTLGGIFIVSALIGVLTSALEGKIDELRKGRSRVLESRHTVILGWSNHVFPILSELSVANANQKKPSVAILADKDKVEMEDEIRSKVGNTGKTRVICRSGSPMDLVDLEIPSPREARSIIILGPEGPDPDTHVLKTALALVNHPKRKADPYHIVAEIRDPKNVAVAQMIGRDEVQIILSGDVISRIMVQTCLQSGLSLVYQELLDFGGDEIYFHEEPRLAGKTFGEALMAYESSALMGLVRADGSVVVNPPMETVIGAGDRVIAISEDDDTVRISETRPAPDVSVFSAAGEAARKPTRVLILGWNRRGSAVIGGLDDYVASGSQVTLVCPEDVWKDSGAEMEKKFKNLAIDHRFSSTTDRAVLDSLGIPDYEHVITLSCCDTQDAEQADASTLVTLLHLRDIAGKQGARGKKFSIVSEMLDVRNRELAQVTQADDFIVSDRLIALLMTQLSENKGLKAVFDDLFDPAGSEIYLKPAGRYVQPGRPVNFYTVVESAKRLKETAIGYRLASRADDAEAAFGVKVNPKKSEMLTFTAEDKVIVLAEEG